MAQVNTPQAKAREEKEMTIIGNGWKNVHADGREFINVRINSGVTMSDIDDTCTFLLQTNPRGKRAEKRDPDYMVSILTPIAQISELASAPTPQPVA